MNWAEIYERFLFLVSVPKCVSCGELLSFGERALCSACQSEYENQKLRECSRCGKKLERCICSNAYLESHFVKRLVKVFRYNSRSRELPGNRLIYSLKQDFRRDVFMFLAVELVAAIRSSIDIAGKESDYIITNVPRRAASIRRYGYDHSAELAKKVGKLLGIRYMRFLVSKAKKAQKEMVGTQRISNINISYARFNEGLLEGKRVILLDDVVTTGSSMGAAAAMIRALGVKTIIGVTASIAFKDSYVRPPK